jgi:hypothetical protein
MKVKPAEMLCRLSAQYGEETLSHTVFCDWYSTFSEDCKEISNMPHTCVKPTAVHDVNIHHIEKLILGNRHVTLYDIAFNSGVSGKMLKNYL